LVLRIYTTVVKAIQLSVMLTKYNLREAETKLGFRREKKQARGSKNILRHKLRIIKWNIMEINF